MNHWGEEEVEPRPPFGRNGFAVACSGDAQGLEHQKRRSLSLSLLKFHKGFITAETDYETIKREILGVCQGHLQRAAHARMQVAGDRGVQEIIRVYRELLWTCRQFTGGDIIGTGWTLTPDGHCNWPVLMWSCFLESIKSSPFREKLAVAVCTLSVKCFPKMKEWSCSEVIIPHHEMTLGQLDVEKHVAGRQDNGKPIKNKAIKI